MHTTLLILLLCLSLTPSWALAGGHEDGGHNNGHGRSRNMEEWLAELPQDKRDSIRIILDEERPAIQELRQRIRGKMQELDNLIYSSDTPGDALARLGWELQTLRESLRDRYRHVRQRIYEEVGVRLPRARGRGCRSITQPGPHF